ncbi:MAG: hypothetical protein IJZ16_08905 [Clostridia bacterium]|nr:hypothetical protein [Clostridia bacterium]
MQLIIATPKGSIKPVECDSVRLTVCDDAKGKNGGSYGIRKGHVKALFSLSSGEISAYLNNEKIFTAVTSKGFATVDEDKVTVVVEELIE